MKRDGAQILVAGGFIRSCVANEPIADIDVFVPSATKAEVLAMEMAEGNAKKIVRTDNAFTVLRKGFPIQIIHRWTFETAEACLESFDYTIARGAFWYSEGWQSATDAGFYPDLAAKRLVYCCPQRNEDAGGSILRLLKFCQRGYRSPLDTLGAVTARLVMAVDLKAVRRDTPADTEAQLAKVLTGLLREVDPNVDPTHSAHLPSEPDPEVTDLPTHESGN
jgi:hypothetical protein